MDDTHPIHQVVWVNLIKVIDMLKTVKSVDRDGNVRWKLLDGRLHREDGPAVEYVNGSKYWWFNGERHREDGPAVIRPGESEEWYLNDLRHREDGPAIILPGRIEEWWFEGLRHRKDGPAMIHGEYLEYWIRGKQILVVKDNAHLELIKKLLSI